MSPDTVEGKRSAHVTLERRRPGLSCFLVATIVLPQLVNKLVNAACNSASLYCPEVSNLKTSS